MENAELNNRTQSLVDFMPLSSSGRVFHNKLPLCLMDLWPILLVNDFKWLMTVFGPCIIRMKHRIAAKVSKYQYARQLVLIMNRILCTNFKIWKWWSCKGNVNVLNYLYNCKACDTCCARLWDNFHQVRVSTTYPYLNSSVLMLIIYVTLHVTLTFDL